MYLAKYVVFSTQRKNYYRSHYHFYKKKKFYNMKALETSNFLKFLCLMLGVYMHTCSIFLTDRHTHFLDRQTDRQTYSLWYINATDCFILWKQRIIQVSLLIKCHDLSLYRKRASVCWSCANWLDSCRESRKGCQSALAVYPLAIANCADKRYVTVGLQLDAKCQTKLSGTFNPINTL